MTEREQDLLHLVEEQQATLGELQQTVVALAEAVTDLKNRVQTLEHHTHLTYEHLIGGTPLTKGSTSPPK